MKRLYLILSSLVLLSFTDGESCIEIDPRLDSTYSEFLIDASSNGIGNIEDLYSQLKAIKIVDFENYYGYYSEELKILFIDSGVLEDEKKLKLILYHELGHAAGLSHTEDVGVEIMSSMTEDWAYYEDDEKMKEEITKFFNQLKNN